MTYYLILLIKKEKSYKIVESKRGHKRNLKLKCEFHVGIRNLKIINSL
jgi:hypothetical protein